MWTFCHLFPSSPSHHLSPFLLLSLYLFSLSLSLSLSHTLSLSLSTLSLSLSHSPSLLSLSLSLQLVEITRWSWPVFTQLVVVNVALNQAWVALLIWLILTFPKIAMRLSPPLAAVMGFSSGFFIPFRDIPWW